MLPVHEFNNMPEQLEELEKIKAYDAAKASDDEIMPFEQAIKEIESKCNELKGFHQPNGTKTTFPATGQQLY